MIQNIQTKWAIDFRHKEDKVNEGISPRLIKYETCQVNRLFHACSKG